MNSLQVQPVARTVTSVRWLPPRAGNAYTDTDLHFISGSSSKHKELVLWTTGNPDFKQLNDSDTDNIEESNVLASLVTKTSHDGDVHAIAAASSETVVTASSFGTISIYNIGYESECNLSLRESVTAHRFANGEPAACTALSVQPTGASDAEVASCGEDGKLSYAPISRLDGLQSHEVDSTVITGICWPTPTQLAISTRAGQVKLFDRRSPSEVSAVFVDPSQSYDFECITAHPSQSFRLVTGTNTGAVLLWDIRNPKQPTMEAFNVHQSNVWSVQFHPTDSSKIVSCSEDASLAVTQWVTENNNSDSQNRGVRHLSSFFNALSINCFDICPFTRTSIIVAGSDSGNLLMEKSPANEFSMF
ncbi:hypothetical protein H4S08_000463 [Coemansia sp. RSA 1365]|nr:hypothetical protein H4S08_000463 [Coemansia sp. RSA 1365]